MKKLLLFLFCFFTQVHAALENPITEPLLCEHRIIENTTINDDPEVILLKRGRTTTRTITSDCNALYTGTHKFIIQNPQDETEKTIYILLRAPLLFHAIAISSHTKFKTDASLQQWIFDIIKILCEEKGAQIDQEIICKLASGGTMVLNPLIAAINNQASESIITYFIDRTTTLTKQYPYKFDAYTPIYYLIERYKDENIIEELLEKMLEKEPDLLHIQNKKNTSLISFALEHKKYSLIYTIYDHMKKSKYYKQLKESKQLKNAFINDVINYIFDSFGTECVDRVFEFSFLLRNQIKKLINKTDSQGYSLLYRLVSCNTKSEQDAREKQDALVHFFSQALYSNETHKGKTLFDAAKQAHCSSVVLEALTYHQNEQSPHRTLTSPFFNLDY
jgi:hypothetical protein